MLSVVLSAAVQGIDSYLVKVETHLESALPKFVTVGLPDGAVKESNERVNAAIKNSGYLFPAKRITINLAPADIRKDGSAFDLPIAVGILAASGIVNHTKLEKYIILGELSLDGKLRPIRGALPISLIKCDEDIKGIILPKENAGEAAIAQNLDVISVSSLREAVDFLNDEEVITPFEVDIAKIFNNIRNYQLDFSDVKGQQLAKRALEVACAGGHNIIMVGPPGSGKSMLAKRLPSILPDLTLDEALDTTKIHSVAGILKPDQALVTERPFRSPHHSISDAGLIGGGHYPRPGEVSLANNGVLFLDELTEFKKHVLELMRQPLEDRSISIARAAISLKFPAQFMLAAAMNPCPCGYYTDQFHECKCTSSNIQRYMGKISGPLLDRIDIHIEVPTVKYSELSSDKSAEDSKTIRQRITAARKIQTERFNETGTYQTNAEMTSKQIKTHCTIDDVSKELLKTAITMLGLSARAYDRILKVSRTIADLEGSPDIRPDFISEAIQYRSLDRKLWA